MKNPSIVIILSIGVIVLGMLFMKDVQCNTGHRTIRLQSSSPLPISAQQLTGNVYGTSQQAKPLSLNKGAAYFDISIEYGPGINSEHFSIWLKDSNGENVELLINEILTNQRNSFSTVVSIPYSGNFYLNINSSPKGSWLIAWK